MAQFQVSASTAQPINGGQWSALQADNGNLWKAVAEFGNHSIRFFYSLAASKGSTWTEDVVAAQGMYFPTNACIYAIGGKIWMTASTTEASNADIRIWWGDFNAGRTAITWNGEQGNLWGPTSNYIYNGGMVVHAEGSGYKVHHTSTSRYYDDAYYWRHSMDSSGAYTGTDVSTNWSSSGIEGTSYSNILLDPATKDVFTVVVENGGSPHVYLQKRAYTGGTWPAGGLHNIYQCSYYASNVYTAFDGDRVVMAVGDGTVNADTPIVLERDKADTTTTTRTPPSGISNTIGAAQCWVAVQTNASKDILLVWSDAVGDLTDVYKNTFVRGTATWSGATLVRDTTPNTTFNYPGFIPGTKYFFFGS